MLPGGDLGDGGLAAGEPAVGQVQVIRPVGGLEVRGEGGLPDAARPGRPRRAAAGPHVGDLHHAQLRGRLGAGAGRAAEVRGVAGPPALAFAVCAFRVGDRADGAVLGQHPQPVPAVVALVASNFARDQRPRAYGLVASAGAIAVAAGPLIGGLFTTYLSWRWVFVGEVLIVLAILVLTGRIADTPPEEGARLDLVGTALSALGLGLLVYGILRSGTWGFIQPKAGGPAWLGLSPVIWLILAGGVVLRVFLWWENHRLACGDAALLDPAMLRNRILRGGLTSFFFQYFLQSGLFFAVPLFLSVALGLSAIATGVRLLPLSITLLLAAAGVPRVFPNASPRRVVQIGFLALFAGIVIMVAALDAGAGPEIVTWPMLLAGLGIGALASQLGSVTVSSVPDAQSGEVGGVQNTVTNLGASIGTALAGAVLISALTASFLAGVQNNPAVPKDLASKAKVELAGGIPFMSDKDLQTQLDKAGVPPSTAAAIVDENAKARIDGLRASLSVLAVVALIALFFSRGIPTRQPSAAAASEPSG